MNLPEVLIQLQKRGTEANRKTYGRHGVREPVHGVAYKDLYELQKAIGTDHALALELWRTGIHDARVLATLIADPAQLGQALLEDWLAAVDNRFLFFAFTGLVARGDHARAVALRWIESPREWVAACGWQVLATIARTSALPDADWALLLPVIERRIRQAPNFTRYAMNGALIGIGMRSGVRAAAVAASKRIGRVDVDHGDSSCETPVAHDYILKAGAHQERRAGKTAATKVAAKKKKKPAARTPAKAKGGRKGARR